MYFNYEHCISYGLRNKFHFSDIHQGMNEMGLVQSNASINVFPQSGEGGITPEIRQF